MIINFIIIIITIVCELILFSAVKQLIQKIHFCLHNVQVLVI